MKGFLLASAASLVCLIVITAGFWMVSIGRRAAWMTTVFLLTLPVLVAAHLYTRPDLGFLPTALTEPSRAVDLVFCLLVFAAACFGGILQLYNLADRGFSLRILIDIDGAAPRGWTAADVVTGYSGGQGLERMYRKRLDGLSGSGLIRIEAGVVELTACGRRVARLFHLLKRLFALPTDA